MSTEDGSRGDHGRVTVPLERALAQSGGERPMLIHACGPEPMLAAVAHLAAEFGRPCEVSVERVMGCGLGGCYSCVVPVKTPDRRAPRPLVHQRPGLRRGDARLGLDGDGSDDSHRRAHAAESRSSPRAAASATGSSTPASSISRRSAASCVKGLFLAEREGHPPPRIVETPAGMLNAIGLQGIGVHRFVRERLPELRALGATVFVNICGSTLDEYVEVAKVLSDADGVAAIELNISCPNIKEGGIQFGCSLNGTHDVVSAVRKATSLPVIPKLTPNVTIAGVVRARGRGSRRGRHLTGQYVPRDGDRRRDPSAQALERHGRTERPGHPADRGADGV